MPNNNDPVRPSATNPTGTNARYYDVTLGAAGTTTLSSAVRIDRFTILGSQTQLNVTSAGSLTSNIDFTQLSGLVTDNGTINVAGDYFMMVGGLQGTGRINTPFFTSAAGMIAPGTLSTIGTLTFGGNVILASGNTYAVNVGPNGTSDLIQVVRNGTTGGMANLGGIVVVAPVAGYTLRYNDRFTIVTAQGGVSGGFTSTPISAILSTSFAYTPTSAQLIIAAGTYRSVVNPNSPIQSAYAQLLDQNRALDYNGLYNTFGFLDLQNAATIQSTLEGLAPRTETTRRALATVATDNMARFYRERVGGLSTDGLDGTLAVIGRPFEVASLNLSDMPGGQAVRSDAGTGMVQQGRLPEGVSGFLAGGYLNGHSRPMPGVSPAAGRDNFDGFYVAGGIETEVGPHSILGFGLSYTNVDGTPALASQDATGNLYQGTIYAKSRMRSLIVDGVFQAGLFSSRTSRNVVIGPNSYQLRGTDRSLALSGEVGLAGAFDVSSLTVSPRVAFRGAAVLFDQIDETGGEAALRISRNHLESYQSRAGLNVSGHGTIRPMLSAYYVHDFAKNPAAFGANFEGGVGPDAIFRLAGQDHDWGEASVGLGYHGRTIDLSVSADTTFERSDVSNQAYRGSVTFHF